MKLTLDRSSTGVFIFLSFCAFFLNSFLFHAFILFFSCPTFLHFVFRLALLWRFHPMFDFMSLEEPRDFLISFILKFASAHSRCFPQSYLCELTFRLIPAVKILIDCDEKLCDSKSMETYVRVGSIHINPLFRVK